jgi:hypothetical protein
MRDPHAAHAARVALVALCLLSIAAPAADDAPGPVRLLDDFEDPAAWRALASDQVDARVVVAPGATGAALCLDYDFNGVSGHAALRRSLPLAFPDNYEFRFQLRGRAPVNDLQFKLIDASGENVWWVNRPRTAVADDWQPVRYRARHVDFAWGPRQDRRLRESADIEFTVYAHEGGAGRICFDELELRSLPLPPAQPPDPVATASAARPDAGPAAAIDGDGASAWRSPDAGSGHWLALDLGTAREFGGIDLHWRDGEHAARYDVELSDDGERWRTARVVRAGDGGHDALHLPESEARYLRVLAHEGPGAAFGIERLQLLPPLSANAFMERLARGHPRGLFPRGFLGEQTYWTVVGLDGGSDSGLMSEDGAVESHRGGWSVEPFLLDDGRLLSWASAEAAGGIGHRLREGDLPMPGVRWRLDGLELDIEAFAEGEPARSRQLVRYTLRQHGGDARTVTLVLAVRPLQVNPPIQFLNTAGGISPIHALAWDGERLRVDGRPALRPLPRPDGFFASPFDAGMVPVRLPERLTPAPATLEDPAGLASAALVYRLRLAPDGAATVALDLPLTGAPQALPDWGTALAAGLHDRALAAAAGWRTRLDTVRIDGPAPVQALAATVRTALAHILISRHGVQIRPGTRSYGRSWIRDGAMTAEALLRLGHTEAAAGFLRWYAPFQFDSGKVPCCVDYRGSDPVPENDSHGQLIHLVAETWRYGRDRGLLASMWPHVERAAAYMDTLRLGERTPANLTPGRRPQYGLMPPSISHEGYSAKPAYSYWDDFWALTGYRHAADLARVLGHDAAAARIAAGADQFAADLQASIRASARLHGIDYIPGAAELGDFDATSTTIALSPGGEQARLPQDLLHGTFERYWRQFVERRDGTLDWDVYTPYEWRNVGAFVRLGWRERAHELIDFFLADRRPAGWNQWAEVVGREPRAARFIGDMPHGWVGSDFIRAVLDLFAYERRDDGALVLAAGLADAWLEGEGVAIEHLRTPWGELGYRLRRDAAGLHLTLLQRPAAPGGLVLDARGRVVWLAGERLPVDADGWVRVAP